MRVEFLPYFEEFDLKQDFMEKVLKGLDKFGKIGICYVIQNKKQAEQLYDYLKNKKNVFMAGQVLGCNYDNVEKAEADAFVFVGTGRFHPIGIKRKTGKPVFVAYPPVFEQVEERGYESRKAKFLLDFDESKNIGLLVSTKKGQFNLKRALELKEKLKNMGKSPIIFLFDTLIPEDLVNFSEIDFWVNFACPRITDDYESFSRPILNWDEIYHKCNKGRNQ